MLKLVVGTMMEELLDVTFTVLVVMTEDRLKLLEGAKLPYV